MSNSSVLSVPADLLSTDAVFAVKGKPPLTILRSIAEDFWRDARDFLKRFDFMREHSSAQSERVKNFVDLRMACECVLKSHALLSSHGSEAVVYKAVRGANHDIEKLSKLCSYMPDRILYDEVAVKFSGLAVELRYSLEATHAFYAWKIVEGSSGIDYGATLGSAVWLNSLHENIVQLISSINNEFTGRIVDKIEDLLENDGSMKEFMDNKPWKKPNV